MAYSQSASHSAARDRGQRFRYTGFMVYQLPCPHCGSPIYFAALQESDEDFQEALCRCRMVFALQQLDVVQLDSIGSQSDRPAPRKHLVHVLLRLPWRRSRTIHQYRLEAIDPEGRRIRRRFEGMVLSRDGRELEAWPEEQLLMLYAVPCSDGECVLSVEQLLRVTVADSVASAGLVKESTTGQASAVEISSMRWRLWGRRVKAGGLATAIGIGSAVPLHALTHPYHWLITGAIAAATAAVAGWSDRYRLRDRRHLRQLDAEQRLLQQQFAMEHKQALFGHQLHQQNRLLKRLQVLQERMQAADESMYTRRIEVVKRGIATVQESTTLTRNLRDGYGQLAKILAIEYETSRLAEELPENNSRDILLRVSELEAMEERRTSLEALVNPQQLLKTI
ncbi:MAG: hypothetical protein AAF974_05730 [Cyanobacteria bacterium P01_E01_bin.34]